MPQKLSSTERGMPLSKVHQMKSTNHVSCSNVKKKMASDILQEMAMTINPSSTERSMPRHNGHLKNKPLTKKGVPQCDVSSRMAAYPIKKLSEVAMP